MNFFWVFYAHFCVFLLFYVSLFLEDRTDFSHESLYRYYRYYIDGHLTEKYFQSMHLSAADHFGVSLAHCWAFLCFLSTVKCFLLKLCPNILTVTIKGYPEKNLRYVALFLVLFFWILGLIWVCFSRFWEF